MRRTASIILLILGGWLLASAMMMFGFDFGAGTSAVFIISGVVAAIATPFLLLGAFTSPGNRLCDLGMTLMITAGVGVGIDAMMWSMVSDPNFKLFMPPNQQVPQFGFAMIPAAAAVLLPGAAGFGLWWFGRHREQNTKPDLEQIFGDG